MDTVKVDHVDGGAVVVVTLDRPHVRNAVDRHLASALCEAVGQAQEARAIVITGTDPAFCAGLDLGSLDVDSFAELPPFVDAVASSAVPVIAAVNGAAVTGGLEIALAADFMVASERAVFADTHLRVGVYPGPVLVDLPRRVGGAWAREMSLTGDFVDAGTALRIGLANHLVPHADLLPFALAKAASIAEQDPAMVRAVRRDWVDTDGGGLAAARETHLLHARRFSADRAISPRSLQDHRQSVLDRSREQRHQS